MHVMRLFSVQGIHALIFYHYSAKEFDKTTIVSFLRILINFIMIIAKC